MISLTSTTMGRLLAPIALVFVAVLVMAAGCSGPAPAECSGPECECTTDEQCPDPQVCAAGVCSAPGAACDVGSAGCTCAAGNRCGTSATGEALTCVEGLCQSPACLAGGTGCACRAGGCDGEGDACVDGFCQPEGCLPGEEHCSCLAGGCDPGFICLDDSVCVDGRGFEGGACLDNNRCRHGNRCDSDQGVCVHCELGSEGCQCTATDTCGAGLRCSAGMCIDTARVPPAAPECYTPCESDLLAAGGAVRTCDSDGLLAGCIDGQDCNQGSCVLPGAAKPVCTSDHECPSFQVCLQGGCYSNCDSHNDCPSGQGCHQKACRMTCQASVQGNNCPAGYTCSTPDGENGYCMPVETGTPGPGDADPRPTGGFEVSKNALVFSNVHVREAVKITSSDDAAQTFTVRKISHTVIRSDGTKEVVKPREPDRCDAARGECPLFWLDLAQGGQSTRGTSLEIVAAPGCTDDCPVLTVGNASGFADAVRWDGELEIASHNGTSTVFLSYVERPEGRWTGSMQYFGSFDDRGVDEWRADHRRTTNLHNGFLLRWSAFRNGVIGWDEFQAVITATSSGSWGYASTQERCRRVNGSSSPAACYPYSNSAGVKTYVDNVLSRPIPTGLTELPLAMNLRVDDRCNGGACLTGRIESSATLHYPANPSVTLNLASDPASDTTCPADRPGDCVVAVTALTADVVVGGRFLGDESSACGAGYLRTTLPWLVDGFAANSYVDPESHERVQHHCRDAELPYDVAGGSQLAALNASLAGGNPAPDGAPRRRQLRILDGALINQSDLFLIFEERFDSFLDGAIAGDKQVISTYGYMLLARQPTELDDRDDDGNGVADVFEGTTPPTSTQKVPPEATGMQCSAEMLDDIAGVSTLDQATPGDLEAIVRTLLYGTPVSPEVPPLQGVHYLCEDTGLIDGGPGHIACPGGSRVSFFAVDPATTSQAAVDGLACQRDVRCETRQDGETMVCEGGTCQQTFDRWRADGTILELDPLWRCSDSNRVYCDDDRTDLRAEKTFYPRSAGGQAGFVGLQSAIESAFRYRTRFESGDARVGFAPQICIPSSDQIPYCYDPAAIEEIRDRVDCLISIYSDRDGSLSPATRDAMRGFLKGSFSTFEDGRGRDGFERFYAELLVMLGDESLTKAFASRFDLAAVGGASFRGELFEDGGINLSGVAGFEMHRLYQAAQYYQMVLDRLYSMGPDFGEALRRGSTDSPANMLSADTVVLYLDRVIRASTQSARTWSEVAKRYQNFNRPDLARRVVERAYTATYLEGTIVADLMWHIAERSLNADRPQIQRTLDDGQRRYRMALLDMRDVYQAITDEVNFFGFAADYIPFPTLDVNNLHDTNAFEILVLQANNKLGFARQREDQALASNRNVESDSATFQAELVRIRNTYEGQLAALCGSFELDGRIYPATKKYAPLSPYLALPGDPCGLVGNGEIYDAMVQVDILGTDMRKTVQAYDNVLAEVDIEVARVEEQCDLTLDLASYVYGQNSARKRLNLAISAAEASKENLQLNFQIAQTQAQMTKCSPPGPMGAGDCLTSNVARASFLGVSVNINAATLAHNVVIARAQQEIADVERNTARWETEHQCDVARADSDARVKTTLLRLKELDLEALQLNHRLRMAQSQIIQLRNRAVRLQTEQSETEEQLINVEAARNNPNLRVYRNDAIINADIAFNDAIRAVYRATRVFEYYTSQSYGDLEKLFLIRMIGSGDYNLENYLIELQNAFFDFEEQFGLPDTRLTILSLRDDILRIPTKDQEGITLTQSQRDALLQERLRDPKLIDSRGYLTIPFRTDLAPLSPLTRNHQIQYMEVNMDVQTQDTLGRVYVRQRGTGVVRSVGGGTDYYILPEVTGVLNTFFNGVKATQNAATYRNGRLRGRPLVNTHWELIVNQRDEAVNQDIDLRTLTDIKIYVYYTDFTVF
jgi:hypothetical protein